MRRAVIAVVLALVGTAPAAGREAVVPQLALWIEPSANLPTLSTRDGVAAVLDRAKAAGVSVVIPEAKTAWGLVTYESSFAPLLRSSPIPRVVPPAYDAPNRWYPQDYDLLQVIIEEAHRRGIQVHVAINVFAEGYTPLQVGVAIDRPEWAALHLVYGLGVVPSSRVSTVAFVNPALPEVQLYELAIIGEVVQRYAVDGVVLDRARYPDATADVSDDSRARFEQWLGRPVPRWPADVVQVEYDRVMPGPLFRQWVAWRGTIIQQFVSAASHVVRGLRPDIVFAAYVGAWYPAYWNEGVNWASPDAKLSLWWVTPLWRRAAIAPYFDYLMVGLYYSDIARGDALGAGRPPWLSVEGGAMLARDLTAGATTPVGSLLMSTYEGQPEKFQAALRSIRRLIGGVMLFDLVFLDRYGWWDLLRP